VWEEFWFKIVLTMYFLVWIPFKALYERDPRHWHAPSPATIVKYHLVGTLVREVDHLLLERDAIQEDLINNYARLRIL